MAGKNSFTLIEMTLVIMGLVTVLGVGLSVAKQFGNWQLGRAASEDLHFVYPSQRLFPADNPPGSTKDSLWNLGL